MEEHIDFSLPLAVAGPLVLLCLALGAYMSAAETAITGASRPRMHRLAQQGNRRAGLVNKLLARKDEAVSAVLLGNSVVNILSASVTTSGDRVAISRFTFEMGDPKHLGHLLNVVRNVEGVYDVYRVTSAA